MKSWTRMALAVALALLLSAIAPTRTMRDLAAPDVVASPSVSRCLATNSADRHLPASHHGHECFSCPTCCNGVAAVDARSTAWLTPPLTAMVRWGSDDALRPRRAHDHTRQARGPPSFS